jgi:hypothetical protein
MVNLMLRVLLYQDEEDAPGKWIAVALEMDLRGYGKTEDEALSYLRDLVETQVSFALAKKDLNLIPFPAPPKYFHLYEQGSLWDTPSFDGWIVRKT